MKTNQILIALMLLGALLLAGCDSEAKVGALRSESHSVELDDASSVIVKIVMGAGDLQVSGGAEKLLEGAFTYNVDKLKPEVVYTDGSLILRQPEARGLPDLRGISDFRNEWGLRLYNEIPMELSVDVGGGTSDLQLVSLSLTRLDVTLGAGFSTLNLNGDWMRDLDVSIEAGATDINVQLPRMVGTRVEIESGPHTVEATGMTKDGTVYTNAAYGVSEVTLQVDIEAGIGRINLEVEDAAAASE